MLNRIKTKFFYLFLIIILEFLFFSNVYAVSPTISDVKFKGAGDNNKIVIFFDQPVTTATNSPPGSPGSYLVPSDFVLGGSVGGGVTINSVETITMPFFNKTIAILSLSGNVNPTALGQWTVAASSSQIFNSNGEPVPTTVIDLNGKGDNVPPNVLNVLLAHQNELFVRFSEEIDQTSGQATSSYSNLQTSATGDTPGITERSVFMERTFAVIRVTTSTILGWGSGNTIDVGGIQDLVGNAMITSTITILPPLNISEVKAESTTNNQDEFIEIYNFSDLNINIATDTFFLHIRNGATDTAKTLTLRRNQIPSFGYYLICSASHYSGTVACDATYDSSAIDITPNSAVYISATSSTSTALRIDLLGMGSAEIFEAATTASLMAGKSFERKAHPNSSTSTMAMGGSDEFKGNGFDTNNNSLDFLLRDIPQPQNSLSPREFPFGQSSQSNDVTPPQVMGSFPSGALGEIVPNNLPEIGFGFNEPVQEASVNTSTVKLFKGSDTSTNYCQSVDYVNFVDPINPRSPGRCFISPSSLPLDTTATWTFKILGDASNATSSIAVRDFNNNALNQPTSNKGDGTGSYVVQFRPSSGGSGFTFTEPPIMVWGTLPFEGSFNIPTNIKKVFIKFSNNVATSSANLSSTHFKVRKISDLSEVPLSSITAISSGPQFTSDVVVLNLGATLSANTEYEIVIENVSSQNGLSSVTSFPRRFTTGGSADTSGPRVIGRLPNISSNVPVSAIDIHIMADDRIDPMSISTTTVKVFQGSNEIPGRVDFDPFTGEILFFTNNVFQASTTYTVRLYASGTTPCIKNLSDICLQDDDGIANNFYEFSFTTGDPDTQAPNILFAHADQRNLSLTFNEPIDPRQAVDFNNYTLVVNNATSVISSLAGQRIFYDYIHRTVVIENLNLPVRASFTITVSNITDLSGNLIGSPNSVSGIVEDINMTGGMVGPGAAPPPPPGDVPQNFSTTTFALAPQPDVFPMSPLAGATTNYFIGIPISRQVKNSFGGGKIVLTFPSGFDISNASLRVFTGITPDANGPGPGVLTPSLTKDASARTITLTLDTNTRCDNGNNAPCSGDAHDFLQFDISGIVNSSIPKDAASGGYTLDIKTFEGTTVLESLTSRPFFIVAGGNSSLVVNVLASGAISGNAKVKLFSPMTGPRDAISTTFSSSSATATFTNLLEGDYFVNTDPVVSLGSNDYLGVFMPNPIRVQGATTTFSLTLQPTTGFATVTVQVTGPSGKFIDIFAHSMDGKFFKKATTTTGSVQNVILKLATGTWWIGVGPQIPDDPFSGPPPAPDFIAQPPVEVKIISPSNIQENSGTINDGTVIFALSAADKTISGSVVDHQGRAVVNADVFAFQPQGGFDTHTQSDGLGKFTLKVSAGLYQVGAFKFGLPPAPEISVEVKNDGTLLVNGQSATSVTIKIIKPERTISGKVLDQNNNPAQNASVWAYCDPNVTNNACLGPGDHSWSPTGQDGSYSLFVKNGTWKVGAFLPGFGELGLQSVTVSSSDMTNVNFSPPTNVTFLNISGTICRDTDVSGSATICGSGDEKVSGVFVRAEGAAGHNNSVSDINGAYQLRVLATTSAYTLEAWDPAMGRIRPLSVIASSTDRTGQDFVIPTPRTITINVKDSNGNFVTVKELFVDFEDFTNKVFNHIKINNANSGTLQLPDGSYKVRAGLPAQFLGHSVISSDAVGTVFATSTGILTVDGNEIIKVTLPVMGVIDGTVKDEANNPIDVWVSFGNQGTGIFTGVLANASGTYSIVLPFATYTVSAFKEGYFSTPVIQGVATTSTTTLNLTVTRANFTISGRVTINNTPAPRAFVWAERAGGGFSSAETGSDGNYTLAVSAGTWRVFAVSHGYAEAEASSPVEVTTASISGVNINLTTAITLSTVKTCSIIPAQGGNCSYDPNNDGIKEISLTFPAGALGSDSSPAIVSISETNVLRESESIKPAGKEFDLEVVDANGIPIDTFNSPVIVEIIQSKADLASAGFDTKAETDGLKFIQPSETTNEFDVRVSTVDYLDASGNLVSSPAADLSNVSFIKITAETTHFSGGGVGGSGDTIRPSAPTGVSASVSETTVNLSWNAVTTNFDGTPITDLAGYRIYRSTSQSSGFSFIASVSSTTTSYSNSGLTRGGLLIIIE